MEIKLNADMITKVRKGVLKSKELVKFILDNVNNASATKDISKTSLSDICIDGRFVIGAKINIFEDELILELS